MAYEKNITSDPILEMLDRRLRRLEAIASLLDAPPKSQGRGGRPKSPGSEATLKPWEAEGVSRNTWYIRKRERRIFEEGVRSAKEMPSKGDEQ